MDIQAIITEYGYIAILIGSFLEGETALIIGGFLAHSGHLELILVMLFAALGSFIGDQLYYYIGRYKGINYIKSKPKLECRANKAFEHFDRHPILFILGFRFMYGLRTVTPFIIGASGYPPVPYTILNIIGVTIWTIVIGSLGYYLGMFAEELLSDIYRYELWILGVIIVAGLSYWLYRKWRPKCDNSENAEGFCSQVELSQNSENTHNK